MAHAWKTAQARDGSGGSSVLSGFVAQAAREKEAETAKSDLESSDEEE
jgi:hypothetical protein